MRVVVDHVAGTRRGQRQEIASGKRLRFGRHPECEVAFDPHRDIDASSRHAELRTLADGWILVDLGSSNGTYVDGKRVTEAPVPSGQAVLVEFGVGGPRVRLFVGDDAQVAALPRAPIEKPVKRWVAPAVVAALVALVTIILALARC